jgi:hypothetical protein
LVLGTSQVLEAGVPPPGHLAGAVLRERDSPFHVLAQGLKWVIWVKRDRTDPSRARLVENEVRVGGWSVEVKT